MELTLERRIAHGMSNASTPVRFSSIRALQRITIKPMAVPLFADEPIMRPDFLLGAHSLETGIQIHAYTRLAQEHSTPTMPACFSIPPDHREFHLYAAAKFSEHSAMRTDGPHLPERCVDRPTAEYPPAEFPAPYSRPQPQPG